MMEELLSTGDVQPKNNQMIRRASREWNSKVFTRWKGGALGSLTKDQPRQTILNKVKLLELLLTLCI